MQHKPAVVVNCKAYEQSFGDAGVRLAKQLEETARIKGIPIIICVPFTEISRIKTAVSIPVYAQHVDDVSEGAHTGWITPQMLLAAGASGTLLNHSEHRIEDVERHVKAARQAGLKVILCARDATEVRIYRNLDVEFLAVEPPELIGGEVSVEEARPELIAQCAKSCPDKLLVGAGVKSRADVAKSLELGAKGILVASHVVKVENPKDVLLAMLAGF